MSMAINMPVTLNYILLPSQYDWNNVKETLNSSTNKQKIKHLIELGSRQVYISATCCRLCGTIVPIGVETSAVQLNVVGLETGMHLWLLSDSLPMWLINITVCVTFCLSGWVFRRYLGGLCDVMPDLCHSWIILNTVLDF